MLKKNDLIKKIEKKEFKSLIKDYEIRLGELQRKARTLGIPIIILFEGWDASGKGTLINNLIQNLDPRGYDVHPINAPTDEERLRPFLWRFWKKLPSKGRIAIFDRSWYGRVLIERVDKLIKKKIWQKAFDEINSFEEQLVNGGTILIKFFLHITKKEQLKRFKKLKKNPATSWKVTKDDFRRHKQYEKYFEVTEEMFSKTDNKYATWNIVESVDEKFATIKVFDTIITEVKKIIENNSKKSINKKQTKTKEIEKAEISYLDKVDLTLDLSKEIYYDELKKCKNRLMELEHEIYKKKIPVIIVYEGWDAAGKGGNIKRLTSSMDPRGYSVIPISAPNDIEKSHHYLWRFWINFPKAGHIVIFDRSWYGRILVERVENFCTHEEWNRAYKEINETEEQFVSFGAIIIKFWLHIDKDVQLLRFKERESINYKQWKITEEDYRNRDKWDLYKKAINDMIDKTSTHYAPWTIIPANSKYYARIETMKTVMNTIENRL